MLIFAVYCWSGLMIAGLMLSAFAFDKLYKGVELDDEMEEGNCWSFAVPRWIKDTRESYMLIRRSISNNWPHVMYVPSIDDLEVEEFRPKSRAFGWKSYLAAVWFRGYVRKGKGEEN